MRKYIIAIAVAGLVGLAIWAVMAGCGKVTPTEPVVRTITGTIQLLIVLDEEGARVANVPVMVITHHRADPGPMHSDTMWTNVNGSVLLDYKVPCLSELGVGKITIDVGDNYSTIEWTYTEGEVAPIWFYILR